MKGIHRSFLQIPFNTWKNGLQSEVPGFLREASFYRLPEGVVIHGKSALYGRLQICHDPWWLTPNSPLPPCPLRRSLISQLSQTGDSPFLSQSQQTTPSASGCFSHSVCCSESTTVCSPSWNSFQLCLHVSLLMHVHDTQNLREVDVCYIQGKQAGNMLNPKLFILPTTPAWPWCCSPSLDHFSAQQHCLLRFSQWDHSPLILKHDSRASQKAVVDFQV